MSGIKASTPAGQCREIGLLVGDTIESTHGNKARGHRWNTSRLTLLWLGEKEAVWMRRCCNSAQPDWSEPEEVTNLTLKCRDWRKVEDA